MSSAVLRVAWRTWCVSRVHVYKHSRVAAGPARCLSMRPIWSDATNLSRPSWSHRVCVCACVRACLFHTHTHTQMKSILVAQGLDVAMRIDARGCVFMSLHITRTHEIQTQTRAHACANADACTRVRVHVHAHSLTHTHKDAYTHTHTHTHTLAASAMANATMDPAAVNMAQRGGGGGRGSRGGRGGRGGASGMGSQ